MKPKKRAVIGLFLLTVCGLLIFLSGCETKDKPAKHVILISMDTTRADHLSCYGFDKNTTPNIDKFAKDSVLFAQCISPVPFTLPAHSSMLTGTNPVYHGVHENLRYIMGDENISIAELMVKNKYRTSAIISTFVLNRKFGIDQGFETYDDQYRNPIICEYETERRGDETSQVAMEWLEKNHKDDFFLFLHYYDPHDPYRPPEPFATQFSDDLYAGEIAYTDFCIGQVLDKLKKLHIYDDSLIIIVGDHGEGLGDHDEERHGFYIYQSSIHVPMIVHFPRGKYKNKRIDQTVGLLDLAPTICRWTGIGTLSEYVGKDLTEYLENKSVDERFIYSESILPTQYGCSSLLSLVSGEWKYIQSSAPEMYNINSDPGELKNLIESEAKRARLFQDELKLVLSKQVRETTSRPEDPIDVESRRKLESLGYISSDSLVEDYEFDSSKDVPSQWLRVTQLMTKYKDHINKGRYQEAKKLCLDINKEKPFYVMAYYYLAETQYKLGGYSEAIKTANEFLIRAQEKIEGKSEDQTLDPIESFLGPAHQIMGMCYFKMNQTEKAIEELNIALEMTEEADTDKIFNNFGNIYLAQGKIDLALDSFNQAIQANPDFHEAYYNVGLVYMHNKEFEKALQSFTKAHALKPDWDTAKQKVEQTKQVIAMRESLESAIERLESEHKKDPRNTAVLDKLGGLYQLLGQIPKAVQYWQQSLDIQPDNATVLNNLAYIYAQKDDVVHFDADKALKYAEKANQLTGYQNPNYLDTLASVYASKGDLKQALEIAQQALDLAQYQNDPALAQSIQKNIEHYKNRSRP